ncbi:MAG: alpha/beta hydrolase-fold protein [Niabella sp.]
MKKFSAFVFISCICMLGALRISAQSFDAYQKHIYVKNNDTLPYRLLLPENYNPARKYPLIIFLHGSGERGNDNEKQLIHGGDLFLKEENRKQHPAIVVFPQCSENSFWSNVKITSNTSGRSFDFPLNEAPTVSMQLLMQLIGHLYKQYPVLKKQVYVMGLSMGGMGTFELVNRLPKKFAAAIPICGGANPVIAKNLKKVSWWVFHGAKDDVVPPRYSENMVAAMKQNKVRVTFTLFPDANHNSWDAAFAEPELLNWLFIHKKK